jgi:biopolymer transport protein ExbB
MRIIAFFILSLLAGLVQAQSNPQPVQSLDELLDMVEQGMVRDAREQKQRLQNFIDKRDEQQRLLQQRKEVLWGLEKRSAALEQEFQQNESRLTELQTRLDERMGNLKELFGVIQQVGGDVKGTMSTSILSAQFPGRGEFLTDLIEKAGSSSKLPSIEELERLWFEMQREMTQSGKVVRFQAPVVSPDGQTSTRDVVRVGTFNAIFEDQYLNWDDESQQLVELPRQPDGRFLDVAGDFYSAEAGQVEPFWLDPSSGSLLALLIQSPSLSERLDQGGWIGYLIVILGLFGLVLAGERLVVLGLTSNKINQQMKSDQPGDNPLGRVMQAYKDNRAKDQETLELKMAEAMAKETPRMNRFVTGLKIISVVAPLMGLLGTVTGMINTFEAMSLFGTGDPKLMAGGISQALVTTVLGLIVAIPMAFLHAIVNGRSRRLIQLLEERAVGIIAEHDEKNRTAEAA